MPKSGLVITAVLLIAVIGLAIWLLFGASRAYVFIVRQAYSAPTDLRADRAGHDLPQPTQEAIREHHQALSEWFRQAASWVRSGEGADAVSGDLPEPPALSGPGDHLTALATWYRLLRQEIRETLDEVGPQPQPAMAPSVGGPLHAAS